MRAWLGFLLGLALASACAFRGQPASSAPSRLAYIGLDGEVYTVPLEGGDSRRVSIVPGEAPIPGGERLARWPTWAPDGTRLAFMRFEVSRLAEDRALIFVVGADGSGLSKVFESTDEAPIYMAWAPDGSSLTLLTQLKTDLRLLLIDPSGSRTAREVAKGGPLYFAWSPDGRSLLLHVNGDHRSTERAVLALLRPDSSDEALHQLSTSPAGFRAPAWSADGRRMAFVAQAPGGQAAIAVQDADGLESTRLATVGVEPAFVWSPTADRLAFSSRVSDQVPLYNGIETIRADGNERQRVTDANVAAFYWSPDGSKLAYAGLDPNARALAWFVSDPNGKNRRQVASFVPSDEQFFMFRFFDQYAQSHAVWSPDGKYLVYAGSTPEAARSNEQRDATPANSGNAVNDSAQVFIAAADGNAAPRAIVDGSIGLWPVSPPRR